MPNKANAWKALRQSQQRAERNASVRQEITYLRRKLKRALEEKDADVGTTFRALQKALDRAAEKGVMKENTVSRLKSRAQQKVRAKA